MLRHPNAVVPGRGQVSVWDFPRPPRVEAVDARVRVEFAGHGIADTTRAVRVCETASPPAYYIPRPDITPGALQPSTGISFCEWKGRAEYWTVCAGGRQAVRAAWSYPDSPIAFAAIRGYVAFYPAAMDACWVGPDPVTPQPGAFYGGWITPELVGPFKGEPGTGHW